jgi:hypothetical protein
MQENFPQFWGFCKSVAQEGKMYMVEYCTDVLRSPRTQKRCWAKLVKAVDLAKPYGYAFVGDFLRLGTTAVPVNSIIIEKHRGIYWAYRAVADPRKEKIAVGTQENFFEFVGKVLEALNPVYL